MCQSVDDFFNVDDLKSSEISEQAAIIHAFLTDPSSAAKSAAQTLVSLSQADGGPELSSVVAQIIIPLAEERPEAHEALLKLLRELKDQVASAICLKPGDSVLLNYELWEKGLRYGDTDPSNDLRDLYRQEWTNINHFAALVYEASIEDLSAFGEHTLQLGLCRGGWRVSWSGSGKHHISRRFFYMSLLQYLAFRKIAWLYNLTCVLAAVAYSRLISSAGNTSDKIDALQGHIDAAVQWILVCGGRLYDERESIRKHWAQWEQDLDWITEQDGLKVETKTICREALAKMRSIMAT